MVAAVVHQRCVVLNDSFRLKSRSVTAAVRCCSIPARRLLTDRVLRRSDVGRALCSDFACAAGLHRGLNRAERLCVAHIVRTDVDSLLLILADAVVRSIVRAVVVERLTALSLVRHPNRLLALHGGGHRGQVLLCPAHQLARLEVLVARAGRPAPPLVLIRREHQVAPVSLVAADARLNADGGALRAGMLPWHGQGLLLTLALRRRVKILQSLLGRAARGRDSGLLVAESHQRRVVVSSTRPQHVLHREVACELLDFAREKAAVVLAALKLLHEAEDGEHLLAPEALVLHLKEQFRLQKVLVGARHENLAREEHECLLNALDVEVLHLAVSKTAVHRRHRLRTLLSSQMIYSKI